MTKNSVRAAFTISILLNLLLIGVVGGMALRQPQKSWHEATKEMSPEAQHLMARTFQKSRRDMGAEIREMRAAKKALAKAVSAKEFDKKAYERAMKRLSVARAKMAEGRGEAIKELAAELPREERKKLAGRLTRPFGGRHERRQPEKGSDEYSLPPREEMVVSRQEEVAPEPEPFVGPKLMVGPPERKPTYGPEPQAQNSEGKESFFKFEAVKFAPPPEPPNN